MPYNLRNPYPLECFAGQNKVFTVSLKDSNGNPINLAGATVSSEVRNGASDFIMDLNATIIDTSLGKVQLTVPGSDNTVVGRHFYDLKITAAAGTIYLDPSTFTVYPTITI